MKISLVFVTYFFLFSGCIGDKANYITVKGRLERVINGEGVSDQLVFLRINEHQGSGFFSYSTQIEVKQVKTDAHGNFSTIIKKVTDIDINAYKLADDNYSEASLMNVAVDDSIILKTNKFIKFKINVINRYPIDENDYIYVDLYGGSGMTQSIRTGILNFGVANTHYPEDNHIGAFDVTEWIGTNVNSIVTYNVPENAEYFKLFYKKRKDKVETRGLTSDIPFEPNQVNEYRFDY